GPFESLGRAVDGKRIGITPGVTKALIGKVLGDGGNGNSDLIFKGIQWALDQGAHVISMSLGFDFSGSVRRMADEGWPIELATSTSLEAGQSEDVRRADADDQGQSRLRTRARRRRSLWQREQDRRQSRVVAVVSVGALQRAGELFEVAAFSNIL